MPRPSACAGTGETRSQNTLSATMIIALPMWSSAWAYHAPRSTMGLPPGMSP